MKKAMVDKIKNVPSKRGKFPIWKNYTLYGIHKKCGCKCRCKEPKMWRAQMLLKVHAMAPHSWIYNILPHYRIYNSKLISKKFPKKLKALLVDIQLGTRNFSKF